MITDEQYFDGSQWAFLPGVHVESGTYEPFGPAVREAGWETVCESRAPAICKAKTNSRQV